jgi:homocysteine S-methyltransferase
VVAYPNSGEQWDAAGRTWTGRAGMSAAPIAAWLGDGARLIGGCCRVKPADIASIAAHLAR